MAELHDERLANLSDAELLAGIKVARDDRLFYLYEALRRGESLTKLAQLTKISVYFWIIYYIFMKLKRRYRIIPLQPNG